MISDTELKEANHRPTLQELVPQIRLTMYCKDCQTTDFRCYLADFGIIIACSKCNKVEASVTPDALKFMVEALGRNRKGIQ